MAALTLLGSTFNTTTGTHTVVATPAVNDLIVIACANSALTAAGALTDNNADGLGTYTQVTSALKNSSTETMYVFVRDAKIGSATSTTFTFTGASSTGGGLAVVVAKSMSKVSAAAVKQSQVVENEGTATPSATFSASPLTTNPIIGVLWQGVTTAPTAPSTFTELVFAFYSAPATGDEVVSKDSGYTLTTVTWGASVTGQHCNTIIELDASASTVVVPVIMNSFRQRVA